ncbi:hypothetical protein CQP49_11590, partial [Yersinia pestis]|nr:hypothetical protein [Yersinia pestis]MRN94564.1 hypothetical protein [Yersinia pestis]MRN98773.1 hypothetical protein [Yersinia pestis]MRO02768.1 hypothetical protein [Yersinia pestis]MRO11291.1 hypothetical protein [Yersinia pestis]
CFIEPNLQIMDKKIQDLGFSAARDPLWNPRACARIACPLRGCPPSSFRLADGFTRVPPRDA